MLRRFASSMMSCEFGEVVGRSEKTSEIVLGQGVLWEIIVESVMYITDQLHRDSQGRLPNVKVVLGPHLQVPRWLHDVTGEGDHLQQLRHSDHEVHPYEVVHYGIRALAYAELSVACFQFETRSFVQWPILLK